jgi:pimeloyl-ACP methyl ester carboxylesterase
LDDGWRVVAPDWRAHGQTAWAGPDYWFSDFLADLDALLVEFTPEAAALLVGHSMGGNLASLYAGVRPERVGRLVCLDAIGAPLDRATVRMDQMLGDYLANQGRSKPRRAYASVADMAVRLMKANPRLDVPRAAWLAGVNAVRLEDGRFAWPHDPAFLRSWPTLHSVAEWGDCWRRIAAPVLCLMASDPRPNSAGSSPEALRERARFFRRLALRSMPETGHNIHVDAPAAVAEAIDGFMRQAPD